MDIFPQSMHTTDPDNCLIVTSVKQISSTSMAQRHQHPRHEIYYLVAGERNYFIRDQVYRVRAGEVVLIAADELHKTLAAGSRGHERMLIEFPESYLDTVLAAVGRMDLLGLFRRPYPVLAIPEVVRPSLENLFVRMLDEYQAPQSGSPAVLRALLLELLVLLDRQQLGSAIPPAETISPIHQTISEVSRYLRLQFHRPLGLDSVARHFALSPSYLSRKFQEVTGVTFGSYLASIRIQKARELLSTSVLTIEEISQAAGFSSSTSFGRAFLRMTGLSPLKYRRMHS